MRDLPFYLQKLMHPSCQVLGAPLTLEFTLVPHYFPADPLKCCKMFLTMYLHINCICIAIYRLWRLKFLLDICNFQFNPLVNFSGLT